MSDRDGQVRVVTCEEFQLVGTEIRTSNAAESDPTRAKIGAHWERFNQEGLAQQIPNRADDAVLYGVYTDYESDYQGPYSHLIACEVSDGTAVPQAMTGLTIPRSRYLAFTGDGQMPGLALQTWAAVWDYFEREASEERAYTTDFERYDLRQPSRIEIYIAVK